MVGRIYITFLLFLYYYFLTLLHFFTFLCMILFFYTFLYKPLAPVSQNHSSVVHSDLKNHNVFCKKINCKGNFCNIASVQYNLNDHKQKLVKTDRKYHFSKKLFQLWKPIASSPFHFTEFAFIFVSISEQKNFSFDRNKRDT